MKTSDPMDPSAHISFEHIASHVPHVDHTLATSVVTALAVNTGIAMAVADTAVRLISSALVTVVTSLIVGWINRRMALQALRAEVNKAPAPPPPPEVPPG